MDDGSHYVVYKDSLTDEQTLEVLAHELGHILQKTAYKNAPEDTKKAINAAYEKWLAINKTKGRTARQVVKSLRARGTAKEQLEKLSDDMLATDIKGLDSYWLSFDEWFADQVSRWAVSYKKPLTIVEKFFASLANLLRQVYRKTKTTAAGFLPDETFANYLDNLKSIAKNNGVDTTDYTQDDYKVQKSIGIMPAYPPETRQRLIDRLPEWMQESVRTITDSFGGMGTRAAAKLGMGNQVLDIAVALGMKSARKLARLQSDKARIVQRTEAKFVDWAERVSRLPQELRGVGPGTVNGIIERMTRGGEWAFAPDYFRPEDKGVDVGSLDPALRQEYLALPEDARSLVREAFRLNYELLKDMQTAIRENINSEYDVLIASETDPERKQSLIKAKQDSLNKFVRMFNIDPTFPYAPLTRYGKWIVVGKSDAYMQAEQEARASGDDTKLNELKGSPDHYFVDFADSRAQAAQMQRQIASVYGTGAKNTEIFLKNEAKDRLYGGRDMMTAFQRMRGVLRESARGTELVAAMEQMIIDLQITAMSSTSVRKAELRRLNVASGPMDMVAAILSRGRSAAHFIGSIHKNGEIADTLRELESEVTDLPEGREDRQAVYNAILERHVDGLDAKVDNTATDKLTSFTSFWMLGFSPSYYFQQLMQNMMITMPVLGARYGYNNTYEAFKKGYGEVVKAWDNTSLTEQLDLNKIDDQYKGLVHFLADSGELDVGINVEMGELTSDGTNNITAGFKRVMNRVRALTRKVEAINRTSAGIAAFDLEMDALIGKSSNEIAGILAERNITFDAGAYDAYLEDFKKAYADSAGPYQAADGTRYQFKPLSKAEFAAANAAKKIITDTHGNYGMENAPVFLRRDWGRLVFQFQKFRIMMVGLYAREFYKAYRDPSLSRAERQVARRTLMFLTGHAAIAGGMMGVPGMTAFIFVYNMLAGDDEERGDWERDVREVVGDSTIANLLMRGVPTLLGVDVSGSLGQGNLLSIAPYTEIPTDRDSYAKFLASMMGPAIGGIVGNAFDAVSLISNGNYYKASEMLVPRGVKSAMQSLREATQGETSRQGELLTKTADINAISTFWNFVGLRPIDGVNRQFARDQAFKDREFYANEVGKLKRAYVEAFRDKDREKLTKLRQDWQLLQQMRQLKGLKQQPILQLLNAPRERERQEQRTVGSVQYTPATEAQAMQLAELAGLL